MGIEVAVVVAVMGIHAGMADDGGAWTSGGARGLERGGGAGGDGGAAAAARQTRKPLLHRRRGGRARERIRNRLHPRHDVRRAASGASDRAGRARRTAGRARRAEGRERDEGTEGRGTRKDGRAARRVWRGRDNDLAAQTTALCTPRFRSPPIAGAFPRRCAERNRLQGGRCGVNRYETEAKKLIGHFQTAYQPLKAQDPSFNLPAFMAQFQVRKPTRPFTRLPRCRLTHPSVRPGHR